MLESALLPAHRSDDQGGPRSQCFKTEHPRGGTVTSRPQVALSRERLSKLPAGDERNWAH